MASAPEPACQETTALPQLGRAERDVVVLGVVIAAIVLFVGTGSSVMIRAVRAHMFGETSADTLLCNALLLNVALIIFGWRRYADMSREVRERRRAAETAHALAQTDALTGCLNRRSLDAALEDLLVRTAATGDDVVLMVLDLDKFKRSNDQHGHQTGDAVLVETTRRILAQLPEGAILARLGGDEFTCALRAPRGQTEAIDNLIARMNEAIARPILCGQVSVDITASIGLAVAQLDAQTPAPSMAQELLYHADMAMYQAKKLGRDRFCWFEPSMETEMRFRTELEKGIRDGILCGEFVPFFEKQVDIETGELTGYEMLARWESRRHGLVSPDIFIPVAEDIGLIAELSELLIRQALQEARHWAAHLTLSVNISPIQLRDPWFAQKLLKLLVEVNFPPERLDIEVTETCLHENIGVVRSLITSLKNQGVRISLDDFGTGYSSLAQLRTLPFDRIKIDRSFVSSLGKNSDSATIVGAISSLGKGMNLPITAEGIETADVLEELRKFGQFKGQGYLYGMPSRAEDVRAELAAQNLLAGQRHDADTPSTPPLPRCANG